MGMKRATLSGNAEPEVLMEVNTTPLIDVMLVLLVMLIITIPIQLHSTDLFIGASKPALDSKEPVVHVVAIDFDGTVYWDGRALADQAAVDTQMQEVGAMAPIDQPEVRIQPNKLVDYGAVAAVMTSAQRHSVKKMGLLGNEQFRS